MLGVSYLVNRHSGGVRLDQVHLQLLGVLSVDRRERTKYGDRRRRDRFCRRDLHKRYLCLAETARGGAGVECGGSGQRNQINYNDFSR